LVWLELARALCWTYCARGRAQGPAPALIDRAPAKIIGPSEWDTHAAHLDLIAIRRLLAQTFLQ